MNKVILAYLESCGFSDIKWYIGNRGYYILAHRYNATVCVDLPDLMNEMLRHEMENGEFQMEVD